MIVTVASGKGGTGKTTVAVNLALALQHGMELGNLQSVDLVFVDCDVEEPNAALFLAPKMTTRSQVSVPIPQVNAELCTYCGECARVCQYHAIAVVGERVLVFEQMCHGCGGCTLSCPVGAITEIPHAVGVVEGGAVGSIRFLQGVLDVGAALAPPIIRAVKRDAVDPTREQIVILDSPPGTSCPVVETMRGSDFVLLVTEPTPFGLHDLRIATEVARDELDIPVGVVINRDGLGDDGVEKYCHQEGIPILYRIPFDRRIAEAYSEGIAMVHALPDYQVAFQELWGRVIEEANR